MSPEILKGKYMKYVSERNKDYTVLGPTIQTFFSYRTPTLQRNFFCFDSNKRLNSYIHNLVTTQNNPDRLVCVFLPISQSLTKI